MNQGVSDYDSFVQCTIAAGGSKTAQNQAEMLGFSSVSAAFWYG
jgi:hypothetical protein